MEIDAPQRPACFLIVHNVSKRRNIGTLIRSAVAFGVRELCLVGSQKYNAFGSHGATDYLPITHFTSLKACCEYLRGQHLCEIIGLEIDDSAQAVDEEPFTGPTAFMVGNEGTGLSKEQRQECEKFVYIRQYGAGTASLNVTVACSIVLHRFCSWAQYQEREHQGGKFKVEERPFRRTPRGMATSSDLTVKDSDPGDGYITDWSNSSSVRGVRILAEFRDMTDLSADAAIKSLYIGDLQDWMDENYIFGLLSSSGEIVNVKIIRNKLTGASDGYGFIECISHEAANRVLEMYNGKPIHDTGAVFRLNWAVHGQGKRPPSEDYSLFVGDLAGEVTETLLLEHFRTYFPAATNARVIMDLTTGRSKGYGFVRFATEQDRDQAIQQMNGTFLTSKTIRVSEATSKRTSSNSQSIVGAQYGADLTNTTLFIGNLSSSITEEYLKSAFGQFGEIIYVKIPVGRNCGFVQYLDRMSAETALASMNNQVLGDCTVRVSWGRNRTPGVPAAAAAALSGATGGTPVAPVAPPPYPYTAGYGAAYDPNLMAAYGYDPNTYAAYYGAYGAYAAAYGHVPGGGAYVETEHPENVDFDPRAPDNVQRMNQREMQTNQPPLIGSSLRVP